MFEILRAGPPDERARVAEAFGNYLAQGPWIRRAPQPESFDHVGLVVADHFQVPVRTTQQRDPDWDRVLTGLVDYVREVVHPEPLALWALAQSADERPVPVLEALVERWVHGDGDASQESLAYQALVALTSVPHEPIETLRSVVQDGWGEPQEFAREWLHNAGMDSQ